MCTRWIAAVLAVNLTAAEIPRTWTQSEIDTLETPLANSKYSPVHLSEDAYYRIPERVLYKSYAVYQPGREPAGYMDWLKQREPEVAFNPAALKTVEQWIVAGEMGFNA